MKTARVILALPGLAALAWGVVLFAEYALPLRPDVYGTIGWIIGGPVLNDGVIAPLTAVLGLILARVLPKPWRAPVVTGTVITGVLAIVAFPLLWRPYGNPPMPGLHDGNPALGLGLTVAAVWLLVVLWAVALQVARKGDPAAAPADRSSTRTAQPSPPGGPQETQTDSPSRPADPRGGQPGTQAAPPATQASPAAVEPVSQRETQADSPGPQAAPGTQADPPATRADHPGT
ncbi:hypothetical protein [Amycolatopsis nalaikhensis]|uniref:Uncharacterized protein n=1 Tax=Amycolatopsis nalaikhensis TaxID=715472 RepID=A0ABY8XYG7_9PSEU|nr:hypothetical protein [Amycolatopsis sp. 2-2]WIV60758.1 hypothetical protein QP939_20155 [Amycolatopsis sp. 2-2]